MIDRKQPAILEDQEIPPELFKKISAERLKKLIARGVIGEIPKSAYVQMARDNADKAFKKLKKENAGLIKQNEKLEAKAEAGEQEKAGDSEKLLKKIEALETEKTELKEEFKKAVKQISELAKERKDLIAQNANLKKQIGDG